MLMSTSFIIFKEEDFVFSFSFPVKQCTAPWLAKGHGPEPKIWDLIWKFWDNSTPLPSNTFPFSPWIILPTFLVLPGSIQPTCHAQLLNSAFYEEQGGLFAALTPVPCSDHLAGQKTRTWAEGITGRQRLRVLTSLVLGSSCWRWF